jgi:hypothetical protein
MRRVTVSLTPGREIFFGAGSAGLVVAFLKAASAACRESPGDLSLLGGFDMDVFSCIRVDRARLDQILQDYL